MFFRGNLKQKWHIDRIYCGRGEMCADISTADDQCHWTLVSDLILAEPPAGPRIEEVFDEEDNKPTEKENQQVKKPVTLADFTDADVGL